jgi:hypothetical protein
MIDLAHIERSLCVDGWAQFRPPDWLTESWRAPTPFFDALAAWHDRTGPAPLKSAPGRHCDLFHDLVLRNVTIETAALTWCELGQRRALSFAELARSARRRAAAWAAAGAQPGQIVALVRPVGPELLVSLLAALQLGLVFSLVPASGQRLARARLTALAPAYVDGDSSVRALFPEGSLALPEEPARTEADGSHAYRAGQPVALLFDDAAAVPLTLRPLSCDAAWLGALRDGAIALGLRRGDNLAAPDLSPLATQPALWLASLMSGASFAHMTLDDVERDGALLEERPFKTVGVSSSLRELLLRRPRALAGWQSWFRDPDQAPSLEPWQAMVSACGLEEAHALNLRWDAALGGATLSSPRRRGRPHAEVVPAAGAAWSLVDLAQDDVPASGPAGRLALVPPAGSAPAVSPSILLTHGHGWLSAGTLPSLPAGRAYPAADALAVAAGVDGCRAAALALDPAGPDGASRVILLLFAGGAAADIAPLCARVRAALADQLGAGLVPDRIECFALFPRRDDSGGADTGWCHQQLRSGGLQRKSADELFRLLARIRESALPAPKEPMS